LLREREFLEKDQPTYKFGKTKQEPDVSIRRLKHYKKGSQLCLLFECPVDKVDDIENHIRKQFQIKFDKHSDGYEYFTGDVEKMKKIIINEIFIA